MPCQIVHNTFGGSLDACITLFPTGRTNLAVCFIELQCINHAQHLIDIAPKRQIVNDLMAYDPLFIDKK